MSTLQFVTGLKLLLEAISGDEKFLLTLGAGIVNTALLMLGFLDQANYVELTKWTVCVYIAGKTYEDSRTPAEPAK